MVEEPSGDDKNAGLVRCPVYATPGTTNAFRARRALQGAVVLFCPLNGLRLFDLSVYMWRLFCAR